MSEAHLDSNAVSKNKQPLESNSDSKHQPTADAAKDIVASASPTLMSRVSRFFSMQNRFFAPMLITSILLAGQLTFGILESWTRTFLAIAVTIVAELVLGKLFTNKFPHLASAYISGISVGILIRSPMFWPYVMCSAASIMSKYVLRTKDRHLWNPSNFGVSAMLFLYPSAVASLSIQWGNNLVPMIIVWCLGSLVIYRLKRFHICASYAITFVLCAWLRAEITGNSFFSTVSPITGPMYQLFIFFMITDPKTTVKNWKAQCLVAVLIGIVEMILRLNEFVHAPYYSLFLVGPVANGIEIILEKMKKKREGQTEPAPSPVAS